MDLEALDQMTVGLRDDDMTKAVIEPQTQGP